jgi:hypothetical protein
MSGFMHGADKLLIVVLAAMDALSISECVGTNLSVSKGLCSLMLSQPKLVDSLGLVTASSV